MIDMNKKTAQRWARAKEGWRAKAYAALQTVMLLELAEKAKEM